MKQLIALFILISASISLTAQSITPNTNQEYCPNTNYNFVVTVPGTITSVTPSGGCQLVGGLVANAFTGRFADVNNTQTFTVFYTANNGSSQQYPFAFKKIKSLSIPSPLSNINTNIQNISSQICQITTHNISFANISFSNAYDASVGTYGTNTVYEYLIPTNWKLGTTTSTGAWIAANNNVTITSDLTSGDGSSIQIRAVNSCDASLAKNQIKVIPITRPEPPLAISGATQLCFPNSYTYNLTGVPSGGEVTWQPNSYYSISGTGNSISIAPTSTANGGTNVTASVYLPICGLTFKKSFAISMGVPTVTFNINGYPYPEPNCFEVFGIYTFQAQQATGYPNTYTGFDWGWRNLTNNTVSNDPTIYGSQYSFLPYDAGTYEIWVKPTNNCGSGTTESVKTVTVVESCMGGFRMQSSSLTVYPNPTKGQFKVQIPVEYRENSILQVSNQFGIMLSRKVPTGSQTMDVDISKFGNGIYQLTLISNKSSLQTKLIKQ